jgi:biotin carboxylase
VLAGRRVCDRCDPAGRRGSADRLLSGTILIVGAGLLQVPAIEQARERGLRVAVTDRDPGAAGFALADETFVLDTKDVAGHVALARELAARGDLKAVFTEGADVEITVAAAARAVGLPGIDPEAARTCNDKAAFRRRCTQAGLPVPRFEEVGDLAAGQTALAHVGVPAIVKPLDSSASRGTRKIHSAAELEDALEDALRFSSTGTALIEECLQGPEQSVETIVADGVHLRCNIVDRPFAFDPFPIEVGHDNPTALGEAEQDSLYALVELSARAVGIDMGAAKADTMWTTRGPVVLEMTARLSGGFHCQATSPLAHGTNDIKAAMDLALGLPLDPADVTPTRHRHALCRSLFPPPGLITEVAGVEEALALPGVEQVLLRMNVGDEIPSYRNCVDRPCFVITSGDTRAEALTAFARAQETIAIRTAHSEPAAI